MKPSILQIHFRPGFMFAEFMALRIKLCGHSARFKKVLEGIDSGDVRGICLIFINRANCEVRLKDEHVIKVKSAGVKKWLSRYAACILEQNEGIF